VGDKVIVLGGGNTAMDAASESARMGALNVTLAYRGSKYKMGAYSFEYDLIIGAGVKSVFDASPVEILGNDSVEGVRFNNSNGEDFVIEADMVIKATGQEKQASFYEMIEGLEIDSETRIKVNSENNQTTNKRYFAGGDAINGGAEVVNGAYDGKLAAKGIHQWLNQ
jgi:glutamate synthase (NADPH/NADH) small chain